MNVRTILREWNISALVITLLLKIPEPHFHGLNLMRCLSKCQFPELKKSGLFSIETNTRLSQTTLYRLYQLDIVNLREAGLIFASGEKLQKRVVKPNSILISGIH